MKKYLFVSVLAVMTLAFAGCEKNESLPFRKKTLDLVVMQQDWQFDAQTQQYYYSFNVPDITAEVYNYGEVSISREYNTGTVDAYQVALPMSTYLEDQVTYDDGTTGVVYYTQHIDYRLGIGYVDIQLTNSDHFYSDENPESMLFRMQLTY